MKEFALYLVLNLVLVDSVRSQDARGSQLFNPGVTAETISRDFLMQQLEDGSAEAKAAAAERRDASFRKRQFMEKVSHFVAKWEQFANEYNHKGAFNIKSARDISKAFHELEHTEGWPKAK
jgi:hypothetical protein